MVLPFWHFNLLCKYQPQWKVTYHLNNAFKSWSCPPLHLITDQNCVNHTTVVNNADTSRTIRKGMKIAIGHTNFHQHFAFASEAINLISHCPTNQPTTTSTIDPLDLLCSRMQHLPHDQFLSAKQVLSDFKDVFSVSNTQIGRTSISSFDVELDHNYPISVPLWQVPLHQ